MKHRAKAKRAGTHEMDSIDNDINSSNYQNINGSIKISQNLSNSQNRIQEEDSTEKLGDFLKDKILELRKKIVPQATQG